MELTRSKEAQETGLRKGLSTQLNMERNESMEVVVSSKEPGM
jgi:hypothetical protein